MPDDFQHQCHTPGCNNGRPQGTDYCPQCTERHERQLELLEGSGEPFDPEAMVDGYLKDQEAA